MTQKIQVLIKKSGALAEKEPFFFITLLLTILLSCLSKPHLAAVHWNVIATMFSLMLVCLAFERCRLLTALAGFAIGAFKTPRKLGLAMIVATGVLSMFVTNDVALLTVVPLTIIMAKVSKKDPYLLIILETMSANLFSALTPFGNPQNLYLFSFFKISTAEFFVWMLPFSLFGAVLLLLLNLIFNKGEAYQVEPQKTELYDYRLLSGAAVAFFLNILSVLRIVDYRIALVITLIIFLFLAPRLIVKVDYFLLFTFVLFFLFTDSVTGVSVLRNFFADVLSSKFAVLFVSAGLSQVISNVPSAVLLSGFTTHARELLYGVSAGGLGTLVASLASLISYKLYIREYKATKYLKVFLLFNFGALLIMVALLALLEIAM